MFHRRPTSTPRPSPKTTACATTRSWVPNKQWKVFWDFPCPTWPAPHAHSCKISKIMTSTPTCSSTAKRALSTTWLATAKAKTPHTWANLGSASMWRNSNWPTQKLKSCSTCATKNARPPKPEHWKRHVATATRPTDASQMSSIRSSASAWPKGLSPLWTSSMSA